MDFTRFTLNIICFLIFSAFLWWMPIQVNAYGTDLLLEMDFNGNTIDNISGQNMLILSESSQDTKIEYIADRHGNEQGAITVNSGTPRINLALNSKDLPQVTLTMWVKSFKSATPYTGIMKSSSSENHRGIRLKDGVFILNCGRDGELQGDAAVYGEWMFVSFIYDNDSEEARMIINDTVYRKMANIEFDILESFSFTPNSVAIDDLKIYNRLLSIEELETLFGNPIINNVEQFPIENRYTNKSMSYLKMYNWANDLTTDFIVGNKNFSFVQNIEGQDAGLIMKKGDRFKVLEIIDNDAKTCDVIIQAPNAQRYILNLEDMNAHTYKVTENFFDKIKRSYLDFRDNKTYIILLVLVLFILLTCFIEKFDSLLMKLPLGNMFDSNTEISGINYMIPCWIFGLVSVIYLWIRERDFYWFISSGFSLIPRNYDRINHWILYFLYLVILLIFILYFIISIYKCGPLGGLIRFSCIAFGNFVAAILLLIILFAVSAVIIALAIFFFLLIISSWALKYQFR